MGLVSGDFLVKSCEESSWWNSLFWDRSTGIRLVRFKICTVVVYRPYASVVVAGLVERSIPSILVRGDVSCFTCLSKGFRERCYLFRIVVHLAASFI